MDLLQLFADFLGEGEAGGTGLAGGVGGRSLDRL